MPISTCFRLVPVRMLWQEVVDERPCRTRMVPGGIRIQVRSRSNTLCVGVPEAWGSYAPDTHGNDPYRSIPGKFGKIVTCSDAAFITFVKNINVCVGSGHSCADT